MGWVGADELAVKGEVKCVGEGSVYFEDGLGGKSLVDASAVAEEVGVEGVEVFGA